MWLGYHYWHGKEVRTPMRFKMIFAVLALVSVLSASQAFAFGGGGGHHDAQIAPPAAGAVGSRGSTGPPPPTPTPGPPALFAVGDGLPGPALLRRPHGAVV